MAPKRRTTRAPREDTDPPDQPDPPEAPASTRPRKVSRTPVVLDDRRRWPAVLWAALSLVWLGGSVVFFVLYLAEGFAMMQAGKVTDTARQATASYLIGLLACALLVPLGGGVTAVLLRRKIAAIGFTVALVASAATLFTLASPVEMLSAIGAALG